MHSFGSFLCCVKGNKTAESGILFFSLILQKHKKKLLWMYTNKCKLFTIPIILWLKVASTVRRGKKIKWLLQRHTVKLSTFTMQIIIIMKNNQSNIWGKKITLLSLNK